MHVQEGWLPSHEVGGLWYGQLTMRMCGMCMLALLTLARVAKRSR